MAVQSIIDGLIVKPIIDGLVVKPIIDGLVVRPIIDGLVVKPIIDGLIVKPIIDGLVVKPIIDGLVVKPIIDGLVVKPKLRVEPPVLQHFSQKKHLNRSGAGEMKVGTIDPRAHEVFVSENLLRQVRVQGGELEEVVLIRFFEAM